MRQPQQVVRHARAALRQATACIAQFRTRLEAEQDSATLDYRAISKAWLRELERLHAMLSEKFFELIGNPEEEVAERCIEFFASYDAFLDEIQKARLEIARELLPAQAEQASRKTGAAGDTEAGVFHASR